MKKFISILLIICTLLLTLASCGSSSSKSNSKNKNDEKEPEIEDCSTTGEHTYENGKCTGCDIEIFEILKDFIKENAHPNSSGSQYLYYCGSYTDDSNFTIFKYESSSNCITILARCEIGTCLYSTDIYLTPYSFEDGEFEWEGDCITYGCKKCTDLSGTLDPSKFSSSTNQLSYNYSSASNASTMAEYYARALKTNMTEEIIPFLKTLGYNITIADLGFARYA